MFQFHNQVTPDENRREFLPSRTQMLIQRIHRCLFLPLRQMGIDFQRDLDVAVAQEFLRRFDVHPGIVERTGHRVPQLVCAEFLEGLHLRPAPTGVPSPGFEIEVMKVAVPSYVVGSMRHDLSLHRGADIFRFRPILCLLKRWDYLFRDWNCSYTLKQIDNADKFIRAIEEYMSRI